MDPTATLDIYLSARTDRDDYLDAIDNYNRWVTMGGFCARVSLNEASPSALRHGRYGTVTNLRDGFMSVRHDRDSHVSSVTPRAIDRVLPPAPTVNEPTD